MADPKYNRKTSEERKQEIQAISEKAYKEMEKYNSLDEVFKYTDFMNRIYIANWKQQDQEAQYFKDKEQTQEQKLYPTDPDKAIYCELTGKAIPEEEFIYKINDGKVLSEQAKELMFTDEEWNQSTEKGNYSTVNFYSFHISESEMTSKEPESKIDNKNEYYFYDGQSKPVKLGTVSDIVTSAQKQETMDHFSINREFIRDLTLSKNETKEEFNEQMQKHNVLKNPKLKDFQQVNERLGFTKDQYLLDIKNDASRKAQMALRNMGMQR
ncbi:hypothetical protein AB9M62_25565 [Bacillales bacterium AN1005]